MAAAAMAVVGVEVISAVADLAATLAAAGSAAGAEISAAAAPQGVIEAVQFPVSRQ